MNRRLLPLLTALAFAVAPALRAQLDPRPLAVAMAAAIAPAADDPDATAAALLAAAAAQPRSPIAALLVAEAGRLLGQIQHPRPLLQATEALGRQRLHGLVAQEVAELRWQLQQAVQGDAAAGGWPLCGRPEQMVACGPFGDHGDDFVGVPFPPELQFPAVGATLPGRGEPATTRLATRRGDDFRIELAAPPRYRKGCWYGRWRFAVAGDSDGFLEVEHDGDCQVFVDGLEVLRQERWHGNLPARQYVGLHLPAGGHEVVVKTATCGRSRVAIRCVDGEGHPLAGLRPADGDGEFTPGAAAGRTPASFVTAAAMLAREAGAAAADPAVRIVAVLAAVRDGNHEAAIDLAAPLRRAPPDDPALALAFARVLRQVALPEEQRRAEARALEERAAAALLPAHHTARLAKAQHLEEQDQREEALRLLAAHPAPGPETFARRAEVLRQLRFQAELTPLLRAWADACPDDPRPLVQLANELQQAAAFDRATALRTRALQLRPDQPHVALALCRAAMASADAEPELLAAAWPSHGGEVPIGRLRLHREWAIARGDEATSRRLAEALADHPEADGGLLLELAGWHERTGDRAAAMHCLQRCQEAGDDRPAVRAWLARLRGEPTESAELARFQRDGRAAAAAFLPAEREQRSSTTLLIDQHVLCMREDGSWTLEAHALRRINDQAGVEAFRERTGLGDVDEVLLVRTLGADGDESVPAKIDGDYAFPRLTPGSFVEWRYRQHGEAPGADVLDTPAFRFGSAQEPCALAEFVVVLPARRGELRTRGLPVPTSAATLADGRTVQVFTRSDLPPLAKERFLPPLLDLLPCAQVGEDTSSFATLRGQRVQLGRRTRLSAPLREAVATLVEHAPDPLAKANAIWSFCQTTIEDGGADDALQTLVRSKGSRFLLAVALLRGAGFPVLPLACRDARAELSPPGESLFHDDAAVQLPGALLCLPDGTRLPLFVDTPRHWPLGRVPAGRAGTTAWIVEDDHAEPFDLPGSPQAGECLQVRGKATVRATDLALQATVEIGDVQGFQLAEQLRQQPENARRQIARRIAQQVFPGWRVERAAIADLAPGQPTRLDVELLRAGLQRDGARFLVPLPLPPTRFAATFGDREERTLPWRLVADMQSDWTIEIDPGPGLRAVGLPPAVEVQEDPLRFLLQVDTNGTGISCHRHVRVTAAQRPAATFGDWLRALNAADRAEQATIELVAVPPR